MHRTGITLMLLATGLFTAAAARADTLWVASGGGNPIPFENIRILRMQDGMIFFRTQAGTEASRPLDQVTRIALDDEPQFTAAEQAFQDRNWTRAIDGYQRTTRTTNKPWLKQWAALRLLESANHAGKFDAAVTAFVALVELDPALASEQRPQLPETGGAVLNSAATEVRRALSAANLREDQRRTLLNFQLELQRARGDNQAVAQVAEQIIQLSRGRTEDPGVARALADVRLNMARLALDQKQYQKAIDEIDAGRALFNEPAQQAAALFWLAEARYGLAAEGGDRDALLDVSLDYMRIVANFKDRRDAYVPQALLRTALIHQRHLDEPETARMLLEQVAQQHGDTPAGAEARQRLQGLDATP